MGLVKRHLVTIYASTALTSCHPHMSNSCRQRAAVSPITNSQQCTIKLYIRETVFHMPYTTQELFSLLLINGEKVTIALTCHIASKQQVRYNRGESTYTMAHCTVMVRKVALMACSNKHYLAYHGQSAHVPYATATHRQADLHQQP